MEKKRRNKFKIKHEEAPYIGHIMIDVNGQQVLKPLYHTAHRGLSLPPPTPLSCYVVGGCEDHEEDKENMNKRNRKLSRKSRGEESRCHHRVKSAYINNRIALYIVPTVRDNRTLLHAYPINGMHHHSACHQVEHQEKVDPRYVRKLEYSSDKHRVDHREMSNYKEPKGFKHSAHKKQKDRSMELDSRGRQFFDLEKTSHAPYKHKSSDRHHRRNTHSGK